MSVYIMVVAGNLQNEGLFLGRGEGIEVNPEVTPTYP